MNDDKVKPLAYHELESFRNRGNYEKHNNITGIIIILLMFFIYLLFVAFGAGWDPLNMSM